MHLSRSASPTWSSTWAGRGSPRVGRTHRGARRGDRAGGHGSRRRRPLHRGRRGRRGVRPAADRSAGRCDEGICADRAHYVARMPSNWAWTLSRWTAEFTSTFPWRGAQGRSVRGRHDGDGAGVDGHRTAGAIRCRHDRRGHPQRPAPHILPIPGTRTPDHLRAWAMAPEIDLTDDDREEIDLLPIGWAWGDRYEQPAGPDGRALLLTVAPVMSSGLTAPTRPEAPPA